MPPMLTDEDLSLGDLPEVSDYSFSFQIPTSTLPKGDDLLADDNTFFEGANFHSVLATPAPYSRTTQSHSDAARSTSRPTVRESSPPHHRTRILVPSKTPGASTGYAESQQSPIIEAPLLSKEPENSEVEIPREAEGNHEHQEESKEPHFASTINSSTTLNDFMSMQPTFLQRSRLESRPEVGYSGPDLPPNDRKSSVDSGVIDRGMLKQLGPRTSTGRQKNLIGKRHTIAGGKLRSKTKAAKTRRTISVSNSISQTKHQPPAQSDMLLNQLTDDEFNRGLSPCVSAEEVAGQLVKSNQLVSEQVDNKTGTTANETEPNRGLEIDMLPPGISESRGASLDLAGQRDEPVIELPAAKKKIETRDVNRGLEFALGQLSPRKRSLRRYTAMERHHDGVTSTFPTLPATGLASRTSKKRLVPATAPNREHKAKKRKGNVTADGGNAEELLAPVVVPAEATMSTAEGSSTLAASSDSAEMSTSRSADAVYVSDVILENEGGREEGTGEDVGKELESAILSTGSREGNLVSRQSTSAKDPMKRLSGAGIRTRVRRSNRLSSSANAGKSLRTRSVSNSVSTRGDVLRASERGRRLALVRIRQEARDKKKSNKLTEHQTDSAASSSATGLKCTAMHRKGRKTRSIDFKFGSDRRMEARGVLDQRASRSTSSLSNRTGDEGSGPIKPAHSIPNVKAKHAQRGASHASRKENIRPVTIPQPFSWATDQRVEERRHFNDTIKGKERERELLNEQKQRERQEEEEREIRELRKRAVPKANTVPEWYKDAPRKKKEIERIGSGSQ